VPALTFLVEAHDKDGFGWSVDMGEGVLLTRMRPAKKLSKKGELSDGDYLVGETATASIKDDGQEINEYISRYLWEARRVSGPSFELLFDAFVAKEQAFKSQQN
jgi:hypothetical protein